MHREPAIPRLRCCKTLDLLIRTLHCGTHERAHAIANNSQRPRKEKEMLQVETG